MVLTQEEQRARPTYGEPLRKRIEAARARAYKSSRRAWEFGPKSPYTGDRHYYVGSYTRHAAGKDDTDPGYIVTVRTHSLDGGFVYSLGAAPVVWLSCECQAATNTSPCKHAARVQLRLEREAREEARDRARELSLVENTDTSAEVKKEVRLW